MHEPGMMIHGIDEAGYGPLLGPLVIARCDARPRVGRRAATTKATRVDDSKRLFGTAVGRARVEATLLGALRAATGRAPTDLAGWLALDPSRDLAADLAAAPWYRGLALSLPVWADAAAIESAAEDARRGRLLPGLDLVGLELRVVSAGRFNVEVDRLGNKHRYLFGRVCDLVAALEAESRPRRLVVDRLGGRKFYAEGLASEFPFRPLEIVEETPRLSLYRMDLACGPTEIGFLVGADGSAPAVSFASMAAKYTRELLMILFNRHWAARAEGLRPTAGYHEDGRRFVADLERRGLVDAQARGIMMRRR